MSTMSAPTAPLMTRREAAEYLNLSGHTLAQWASKSAGPPFYKVGGTARYRVEDLNVWLDSNRKGGGGVDVRT